MRRYVECLKSQQGFTLIELIAAITIFSMVVGIISMVTMFGFRSYHKITIENSLRDEADIIMSSIINELYIFAPERVERTNDGILLKKEKKRYRLYA
ncbi:PilW family protein [Paenibacillus rhizoplanae]